MLHHPEVISVSGASALNVTSLEETLSHSPERWTYWSNTQLTEFVQGMERGSPDRCKAYTIGESRGPHGVE